MSRSATRSRTQGTSSTPITPKQFLDVRYLVDDQGFSVQPNYNGEEMDQRLGFVPDR